MRARFIELTLALAASGAALLAAPLANAQSNDNGADRPAEASPSSESTDSEDGNWGTSQSAPASADTAAPSQQPTRTDARPPDPADADPRALTAFRAKLDTHGTWVNHPTYGTVWVPNRASVGENFAPYVTNGRWALDDNGDWTWVSDYSFGDVVFHYGRWVWVAGTGWVWVPGYQYAPAWVTWRVPAYGYAYVGWAPAPPAWVWFHGSAVSLWMGFPAPYVFIPSAYVFYPHPYGYIVRDPWRVHRVAGHTVRYYPHSHAGHFGPPLARAAVPRYAVPATRVPARPLPATPIRTPAALRGPGSARQAAAPIPRGVAPMTGSAGTRSMGGFHSAPTYRSAPVSRSAPSIGSAPRFYGTPVARSAPSFSTAPAMRSSPAYGAGPSFRSTPSFHSAPTVRSAPSYRSAPSFRSSPSFHSAPAFRSAPSFHSAPSYRSAPAFRSAPSFHSAPSFRSAPAFRGGGGFRR